MHFTIYNAWIVGTILILVISHGKNSEGSAIQEDRKLLKEPYPGHGNTFGRSGGTTNFIVYVYCLIVSMRVINPYALCKFSS